MIVNESQSTRIGNFSALLNAGEFSDGFGGAAFLEDGKGLPEDEDRVGSFFHFLGR